MLSRGFLVARTAATTQVRGKAIQNLKRPNMDEYMIPTQPWDKVMAAKKQKSYVALLISTGFFVFTFSIIGDHYWDFNRERNQIPDAENYPKKLWKP